MRGKAIYTPKTKKSTNETMANNKTQLEIDINEARRSLDRGNVAGIYFLNDGAMVSFTLFDRPGFLIFNTADAMKILSGCQFTNIKVRRCN